MLFEQELAGENKEREKTLTHRLLCYHSLNLDDRDSKLAVGSPQVALDGWFGSSVWLRWSLDQCGVVSSSKRWFMVFYVLYTIFL